MRDPVDLSAIRPRQAERLTDETLEELNRLWTVVRAFSTAAHDVNNALQVIAGSAELLEARELEPAVRRRVEIVRQESGKAAATINRLLDYARAHRQPVERFDVWPVIDAAVSMRLASLGRSRIVMAVNRDGQTPTFITAEPARVLQCVLDLLLVAEGRLAGKTRARIELSVVSDAQGVAIAIATSSDGDAATTTDDTGDATQGPDSLTRDAELWAAAYLAALYGGVLAADEGTFSLSFPP